MQPVHILVVEDIESWQREVCRLIEEVCQSLGLQPQIALATTMDEAVRCIDSRRFDIATIDNKLSGQYAGALLLDRLSSLNRDTAVVVISGDVGYPRRTDLF